MMKEFARRLDEDGRTSQYPTTLLMIATTDTSTK
jgi:hypothetical protein